MLNREDYDDNLNIDEKELDKFESLSKRGYKPYSSWFESMCKKLKFDRRKICEWTTLGLGRGTIRTQIYNGY